MAKKVTLKNNRIAAFFGPFPRGEEYFIRVPFGMLVFSGLIIILLTIFFVLRNIDQEKDRLMAEMKNRADVLIWAMEGGVRSMRSGPDLPPPPPAFVEEVVKQPYILSVALLDENGVAVIHSDRAKTGEKLRNPEELHALPQGSDSVGQIVKENNENLYEVIKPFTPAIYYPPRMQQKGSTNERQHSGTMHRHEMRFGAGGMGVEVYTERLPVPGMNHMAPKKRYYILVSIDAEPFFVNLFQHSLHVLLISCLMVVSGAMTVALLIFVYNYKTSARLLKDTRSLALQVFERLPIGVFTTDENGFITLYNKACATILGFERKGKNRKHICEYPWFDWEYFTAEMKQGHPVLDDEYEFPVHGETTTISVSATKISSQEGKNRGFLFIVRDMGEVKQLQKQVRLNERLSALGNLAAGVAHEIRNPLSTVKGYATILTGKVKGTASEVTALHMLEEVERLNRVVSDLLSMAKTGEVVLKEAPLMPVIERAIRLAGSEADNAGVTVRIPQASSSQPEVLVQIDEDRLLQALLNLLINAVQASETGGSVEIELLRRKDQVILAIKDTGSGMDANTQSRLFSPYFTTKASGTGLGLTIAHQIIEQHGGNIRVQSEPGKGSVFSVILPALKPLPGESA